MIQMCNMLQVLVSCPGRLTIHGIKVAVANTGLCHCDKFVQYYGQVWSDKCTVHEVIYSYTLHSRCIPLLNYLLRICTK